MDDTQRNNANQARKLYFPDGIAYPQEEFGIDTQCLSTDGLDMSQPLVTNQYLPAVNDTASQFTDQLQGHTMETDPFQYLLDLHDDSSITGSDFWTIPTHQPSSRASVSEFQAIDPVKPYYRNGVTNFFEYPNLQMHPVAVAQTGQAQQQIRARQTQRNSRHGRSDPGHGRSSDNHYQKNDVDSRALNRTSDGVRRPRHRLKRCQLPTGPASSDFATASHTLSAKTRLWRPCGDAIGAMAKWLDRNPDRKPNIEEVNALRLLFEPDASLESLQCWFERLSGDAMESPAKVIPEQDIAEPYRFNLWKCVKKGGTILNVERSAEKPLPCTARCGDRFKDKEKWKTHELHNYPQELWYCRHDKCAKRVFFRKHHFKNHLATKHEDLKITEAYLYESYVKIESQYSRKCLFEACHTKFKSWKERLNHLAEHFRGPWVESEWRQPLDEPSRNPAMISTLVDDSVAEDFEDPDNSGDDAGAAPSSGGFASRGSGSSRPPNYQPQRDSDSRGEGASDRHTSFSYMSKNYRQKVCWELVSPTRWFFQQDKDNSKVVLQREQKLSPHCIFHIVEDGADVLCYRQHNVSDYRTVAPILQISLPPFLGPTMIHNLALLICAYLQVPYNRTYAVEHVLNFRYMFPKLILLHDRLCSRPDPKFVRRIGNSYENGPISMEIGRPAVAQLLCFDKSHESCLNSHTSSLDDRISGRSSCETVSTALISGDTTLTPNGDLGKELITFIATKRILGRSAESIRSAASLASDRPYKNVTRAYASDTSVTMVASNSDTATSSDGTRVEDTPVTYRTEASCEPLGIFPTNYAMSRFLSEYDMLQSFLINGSQTEHKNGLSSLSASLMPPSCYETKTSPVKLRRLPATKGRLTFFARRRLAKKEDMAGLQMGTDMLTDLTMEKGVLELVAQRTEVVETNGKE